MSGMRKEESLSAIEKSYTMQQKNLFRENQKRRKTGQHMNPDLQQLEG